MDASALKPSQIINKFLLAGFWLLVLRHPASGLLVDLEGFVPGAEMDYWIFGGLALLSLGTHLIDNSRLSDRLQQLFSLVLPAAVALIPVVLGWPPVAFIVFTLILYILAIRGSMYGGRVDFSTDLPWILLIYLGAVYAGSRLGQTPALYEVFLFIFLIIWHGVMLQLGEDKFSDTPTAFKTLFPFFAVLVLASLLLALPFNLPIAAAFLALVDLIGSAFFALVDLILWPVAYLVLPVYYLFRFLQGLFGGEPEVLEQMMELDEGEEMVSEFQETAGESSASGLLAVVIIALLLIFALWLLRRYLGYEEREEGYVKEEREDLGAASLFREDVKNLISGVRDRFRRKSEPDYDRQDPCQRVRYCYYSLLKNWQDFKPRPRGASPRRYFELLTGAEDPPLLEDEDISKQLWQLTRLYEDARYGGEVSEEEAGRAEEIWRNLKGMNLEAEDENQEEE